MEQLNRIELIGKVGSVRTNTYGDRSVANFSVATHCTYTNKEGQAITESTWHQVTAWSGKVLEDLSKIVTGANIQVVGRIRNVSFTGADGTIHRTSEVVASSIRILEEETTTQTL